MITGSLQTSGLFSITPRDIIGFYRGFTESARSIVIPLTIYQRQYNKPLLLAYLFRLRGESVPVNDPERWQMPGDPAAKKAPGRRN